jgi:aspartate aminotransferase
MMIEDFLGENMSGLSTRISSLSPSPTVALNGKAKALKAEGIDVLNFAVGEPDFTTPEPIIARAIEALKEGKTKYGPAGGGPAIRQAIIKKLQRDNNLSFEPNEIVVGMGAKEILLHIFMGLLNEGDEVLVPAPYWVSYTDQVLAAGGTPIVVPMNPNDNSAFNMEGLRAAVTPKTKVIVLNSPSNPAGTIVNQETLKEIGALALEHDLWIVSDEIYEYLSFDEPHVSLLELMPALRERFILVNGMSKGFAMTGWRVGYAAGPVPLIKLVNGLQSHSSTCLPQFIEGPAAWALEQGKALMEKEIGILKKRRDIAVKCLDDIQHISYVKPQGAFYVFIDLREALAKSKSFGATDTLAFGEHLLMEHHVAMVPGEAFGCPGFLRLSYATSEDNIRDGLGRLKKAVDQLN